MTNTPALYSIPADILKAATTFASKDAFRPHLNSLHFDPPTGHVVATDGHTLLRLSIPCGVATPPGTPVRPFSLSVRDVLVACKAAGSGGTVEIRAQGAAFELTALPKAKSKATPVRLTVSSLSSDVGTFPPYQRVIPEPSDYRKPGAKPNRFTGQNAAPLVSVHAVDARYLGRLASFAETVADCKNGGNGQPQVDLVACAGAMEGIRYNVAGHVVVIMPRAMI
jgi:hypothetical protein